MLFQPVLPTMISAHLASPHQMMHVIVEHVFEPFVVNSGGYQNLHCQVLACDVHGTRTLLKKVFPDNSPPNMERAKAWSTQFRKGDIVTIIYFIFRPVMPA